MSNIIGLVDVRKVYKMGEERIPAVNGVSFDFEREKTYCILGTSGSGKSTLLNLLAGLEKPTKGQVIFNNSHLEKLNESELAKFRQKYVGFVFQSYNLLPTLTALENVSLPLIFSRMPGKARRKRAIEMLKAVGLHNRMHHKPSEMSGGQQQRVSIARAFVNVPQVVFADEPTGNLDTKTTFEMMDLMTGLAKEHKQTLIIVTHDVEIGVYADKIIHMKDGVIDDIKENIKDSINESEETEIVN